MDKVIETISVNQIPFDIVEKRMGIPHAAFLNADNSEAIIDSLTTLTNGRSCLTPLMDVSSYDLGFKFARFSLYAADGKYHMLVHPLRDQEEFDNEFDLTPREIELLYKGETLIKLADPEHKGELVECLIQIIPGTNAQVCCPRYTINIPKKLGSQEITPEMKRELTSGVQKTILTDDNAALDVRIDLSSHKMLSIKENNDRLLRSKGNMDQSQQSIGMGSVIGPKPGTKTSKNRNKGKNPGKAVDATAAAPSVDINNGQQQGGKTGVKR